LNPFELFKSHDCKDIKGIHAMLAKAAEIDSRRHKHTA
jgi:quinone-modifying oxidoreductase, subunit QmoC